MLVAGVAEVGPQLKSPGRRHRSVLCVTGDPLQPSPRALDAHHLANATPSVIAARAVAQPPTGKSLEDYLISLESKLLAAVGKVQTSFNTNLLTAFGLGALLIPISEVRAPQEPWTVLGFTPDPSFAIPFVSRFARAFIDSEIDVLASPTTPMPAP